jgi:thiamine biosynthesis protein ThiS
MSTPFLTLVTNQCSAGMPIPDLARHAVDGGVDIVHVRERLLDDHGLDDLVSTVVRAVGAAHVAVNGAPEIAARHGVHLHLPERSIADFVPHPNVPSTSCSVHALESLAHVPSPVSYLILGHLFPSATHREIPPLPFDRARAIVATAEHPVVAIGGITPENASVALSTGVAGIAVMSYVNSSCEPRAAARELRDVMEEWKNMQTVSISVEVNGKPMAIDAQTTLTAFLEGRNLHPRLVVVERNREIVAKSAYDSVVLEEGDLLEIAHFVGGG